MPIVALVVALICTVFFIAGWKTVSHYERRTEPDHLDYYRIAELERSIWGRTFYCDGSPWNKDCWSPEYKVSPDFTRMEIIEAQREITVRGLGSPQVHYHDSPVDYMAQEKWLQNRESWQDYEYRENE
jgi:hypothetical protein